MPIMFGRIEEWLTTKPVTKAAWTAALIGFFTLIVVTVQAYIYYRQAIIMERQARVAEEQSKELSNQIQLSTRPYIDTTMIIPPERMGARTLAIHNKGIYPVQNLHLNMLYFAKVPNHGWWVVAPLGGVGYEKLPPKNTWAIDLKSYIQMFRQGFQSPYSMEGGLEYLVFLVSFEREFDGKAYLYLDPVTIVGDEFWPERDSKGGAIDNITGPLNRVCSPAIELTFAYFRRRPMPKEYELYNYSYALGYSPTGCLGPIQWNN